jgi:hypothetical protein
VRSEQDQLRSWWIGRGKIISEVHHEKQIKMISVHD